MTDSEEGVAVSPTVSQDLYRQVVDHMQLPVSCMTKRTITSNSFAMPIVAESARTVSNWLGGVEPTAVNEADRATGLTAPTMPAVQCRLKKLLVLIPASEGLFEDAQSLVRPGRGRAVGVVVHASGHLTTLSRVRSQHNQRLRIPCITCVQRHQQVINSFGS